MNETSKNIRLDPRTKIALLLMLATFVLGGLGGTRLYYFRIVYAFVPFFLLAMSGKLLRSMMMLSILIIGFLLQYIFMLHLHGFLSYIILAIAGLSTQLLPSIAMGYFVMSTTSVSEFVAAMQRMHIGDSIVIPLSVMFRFFPTVVEEYHSINDAMRMRGISFQGKHPARMIEYRIIPMLTCSLKIGEELSVSALTRGLGSSTKRTNICTIGFHFFDSICFIGIFITLVYWLIGVVS